MSTTLSKSTVSQLQKSKEIIDGAKANFNGSVVTIGRELSTVRELLPHGDFLEWVEENCGFSKSTAYNYIEAFKTFGNFQRLEHFDPDCLYLLSRCEPAAKEAKAIANRGQIVTLDRAKAILQKFKEVAKPKPKPAPVAPAPPADDEIEGELVEPEAPAPPAVEREPGDDTAILKAEAAKRRASGRELVTPKERREATKAFGVVTRFIDKLKRHDDLREHLAAVLAVLEGKA